TTRNLLACTLPAVHAAAVEFDIRIPKFDGCSGAMFVFWAISAAAIRDNQNVLILWEEFNQLVSTGLQIDRSWNMAIFKRLRSVAVDQSNFLVRNGLFEIAKAYFDIL